MEFKNSYFAVSIVYYRGIPQKLRLSSCLMNCVSFARYCGKMHSCHRFSYAGLFFFLTDQILSYCSALV